MSYHRELLLRAHYCDKRQYAEVSIQGRLEVQRSGRTEVVVEGPVLVGENSNNQQTRTQDSATNQPETAGA